MEAAQVNNNIDLSFPNDVPVPYYYTNPTMLSFTGGGGATYGGNAEPIISPVFGDWSMPPAYRESYYDKAKEKASPGYYSVELETFKTRVELTATRWASLMRFTFPASERANVLVNFLDHGGQMEVVGDRTVRGVAQDSKAVDGAYFVAEFSEAFSNVGTFHKPSHDGRRWGIGDKHVEPGARQAEGSYAGTYLTFRTKAGEQVLMKIAHGTSYEQAEQRLREELPGCDFDGVHQAARNEWTKLLDRVQVEGGTPEQRTMFIPHCFNPSPVRALSPPKANSSRTRTARCRLLRTTATVRCPPEIRAATRSCCSRSWSQSGCETSWPPNSTWRASRDL